VSDLTAVYRVQFDFRIINPVMLIPVLWIRSLNLDPNTDFLMNQGLNFKDQQMLSIFS
jgi:hypothetical protein